MYSIFFIHFSIEGHLGGFQFLAIMIKAANNAFDQVSSWYGGTSFEYMPSSDIAGSWSRAIFNFLRNHQTNFQSGYTSLHSHQQWRGLLPCAPHPWHHVLSLEFLIYAIIIGISLTLRVVLTCIYLIIKDIDHFAKCFSAIKCSSPENSI